MNAYVFTNNASSRLAVITDAVSPTLTMLAGGGGRFPMPADGDFFMVTIDDRRTGQIEICKCTHRSGDILTVVRGQEDTTAQAFMPGATVSHRLTAGTLEDFQELANGAGGYTQAEADDRFVNADGDTMLGPLILPAPIQDGHATNKLYVDTALAGKANTVHQHAIADIINLQATLDLKLEDAPKDADVYGRFNGNWDKSVRLATYTTDQTAQNTQIVSNGQAILSLQTRVTAVEGVNTNQDAAINGKVTEAPDDGFMYGRQSMTWSRIDATSAYIGSVPPANALTNSFFWNHDNGGLFIKYDDSNSIQWVQVNAQGLGDAPADGKDYVRNSQAWKVAQGLIDAPNDGQLYARKSQTWSLVPPIMPDAPNNANFYGRKAAAWSIPGIADINGLQAALNGKFATTGGTISGPVSVTSSLTVTNYVSVTNGFVQANMVGASGSYALAGTGSTQTGGVLGYNAGNSLYWISGYGSYAGYGAGTIWTSGEVQGNGHVRSLGGTLIAGGHSTTTNAASVWMNSNGTLYRSTSLAAYKMGIEDLTPEYADKVLQLRTVFYRPNEKTIDRTDWSRYGFIADDCHSVDCRFALSDPDLAEIGEDGNPVKEEIEEYIPNPDYGQWLLTDQKDEEMPPVRILAKRVGSVKTTGQSGPIMHDLNAIVAALLNVVKRQQIRIAALEAR